jgi:hypothetical protein
MMQKTLSRGSWQCQPNFEKLLYRNHTILLKTNDWNYSLDKKRISQNEKKNQNTNKKLHYQFQDI